MRPVPKLSVAEAASRDAASIAQAAEPGNCDLLVTIGGSGVGRTDAAIAALARYGEVVAHGIALLPGRTAAVGGFGRIPVIALPGAPDQALAAWWTWHSRCWTDCRGGSRGSRLPCRWRARLPPASASPKSSCLSESDGVWMPLAVGDTGAPDHRPRRCMAGRARRVGGFCCGHGDRCLYVAGMMSGFRDDQRALFRTAATGSDQDQFLTVLSREHALARFEAALFPRAVASEQRQLADGAWLRARGGYRGADRCAAVRSLQCRRLCGALGRSRLRPGKRRRFGVMLNDEVIACGTAPTRPVLSGTATLDCDRGSGAARRRCHRHGRAYPAR